MSERIMDLFERSGDGNLGETLIRLAGLAAAVDHDESGRSLDETMLAADDELEVLRWREESALELGALDCAHEWLVEELSR